MIAELLLHDFGKFRRQQYPFAVTTIFYGKNESGKTTLFDALFKELCHPKAAKRHARQLKQRYGNHQQSEIALCDQATPIDEDEFLSLYAVRSGDLNLELAPQASWSRKVKARLFTGGMDPVALRQVFDLRASSKGTLKHNRALTQFESEKKTASGDLAEKRKRRIAFLEREKLLAGMEEEAKVLERRLGKLQNDYADLERRLRTQRKSQERREARETLLRISKLEKMREILQKLSRFRSPEIDELDAIQRQCSELSTASARAEERERGLTQRMAEKREELLQVERESATLSKLSLFAREYLDRLSAFRENLPTTKEVRWNIVLFLPGLIVIVAAAVSASILADPVIRFVVSGVAAAFGGMLVLFSRRLTTHPDTVRISDFLKETQQEFAARAGAPLHTTTTLEGLTRQLIDMQTKSDARAEELVQRKDELIELRRLLEQQHVEASGLNTQRSSQAASFQDWLKERGVSSRDEYIEQAHKYETVQHESMRLTDELSALSERYGLSSLERLELDCRSKLKDIEAADEVSSGTPPQIPELELQLRAKRREIERHRQEIALLQAKIEREKGEIRGALGELPEEIAAEEKRLEATLVAIDRLLLDRKAAALAREIFDKIAQDSQAILGELARDMSEHFGHIVPELRDISVSEFSTDSILVTDAGGKARPLANLSKGTQDAFILAARISLARRSFSGRGILVLDEPFYALDSERTQRAIQMLRHFQQESQWQIVFFTKDKRVLQLVLDSFPDAVLNLLDGEPGSP